MDELTDNIEELQAHLGSDEITVASKALDKIAKMKGRKATRVLTDFLATAPLGLLATKAALALETREHASCLPAIRQIYTERPELAEDLIPILSKLEDPEGIPLVVGDLRQHLAGPARLAALAYLVKCAESEALAELLLPALLDPVPGSHDDVMWAYDKVMRDLLDEASLRRIYEEASIIGAQAIALVEPYMPAQSELERQAPAIAEAFVKDLVEHELIETVPGSEDALVELIANTILEARSPKGLIRDVERILLESTAVDEVYAGRDDLRSAFARVTADGG